MSKNTIKQALLLVADSSESDSLEITTNKIAKLLILSSDLAEITVEIKFKNLHNLKREDYE